MPKPVLFLDGACISSYTAFILSFAFAVYTAIQALTNAPCGLIFALGSFARGGGSVDILVTDDTGREAEVTVNKETKQAYALNTGWSDYVAGTRIIENKGKGIGSEYAGP